MKVSNTALLLLSLAGPAVSGPPENWPELGTNVYLVPASVERFGNTLHFAAGTQGDSGSWIFSWRWIHCQKPWISDITALGFAEPNQTAQNAYAQVAAKSDNFFKEAIEFLPITTPPFGDGTQLRKHLNPRCKVDGQSQSTIELPIAQPARKIGVESFVDYLLLRTTQRRGEVVEGWIRRRPIVREEFKGPDGTVFKKDNGEPFTRDVFTSQDTSARFKVSANCSARQTALSRFTEYNKEGNATSSAREDSKLNFQEPVPGTIGEAYLDVLCRL